MEALKNVWTKIALVFGAIIGVLLYYLSLKNKQANALQAKVDLADTQKKNDLLEVEIKQKMDNTQMLQKEIQDHQETLNKIEEKRQEITKQQENKTNQEIVNYWDKK